MNAVWTEHERDFIVKNAGRLTDDELAKELTATVGREVSLQGVRKQRQKLGIKKCGGRGICRLQNRDGELK